MMMTMVAILVGCQLPWAGTLVGISCLGPVLYDGDCDDDDHGDVDDDEDDENSGCPGTVEGISYLGPVLILFLLHSTPSFISCHLLMRRMTMIVTMII